VANHFGIQSAAIRQLLARLDARVFATQARREIASVSRAVSC
jgi:hypothetical protein